MNDTLSVFDRLQQLRASIESDLRGNILPFWTEHVADWEKQGFHAALTNTLNVDDAQERGALLTSRILWTYAAAYRRYGEVRWLRMAEHAYRDLQTRFLDVTHGGYVWSIDANGAVLRDRKQVYGQAFAIYALTEYYAASGERAVLDQAIAVYRLIEANVRDRQHGGYFEAFGRDWRPIADMRLSEVDLNAPKSQNTLLHVMEAYTNLLSLWPDQELRAALAELVDVMLNRVLQATSAHLGLFFTVDWQPLSDRVSFGHDIEAAWLLTAAAEVSGDAALSERIHALAVRIADVTLAEGVDGDGAILYEGSPNGITNDNKEWWPQAEAVIGFLNAFEIAGESHYLDAAIATWHFIDRRLIDRQHGEWYRAVSRDGQLLPDPLKVSFWKCPYHNGRMGLEVVRRVGVLMAGSMSPVSSLAR